MDNELPKRKRLRLDNYDYSTPGAYFITICTHDRRCTLSRIVGTGVLDGPQKAIPDDPMIELLPCGKIADKYINQLNDFYNNISVEKYVIMPNHIHILLIVHAKENELFENNSPFENGPSRTPVPTIQNSIVSRFVSTFKRFCNKEYGENIWQIRFYDHIIRDQHDYEKIFNYICENPIYWQVDKLYAEE